MDFGYSSMNPALGFAEGSNGWLTGYPALSSNSLTGGVEDWSTGYPDQQIVSSFNSIEEMLEVVEKFDPPLQYILLTEGDGNCWFRAIVEVLSNTKYQSQLSDEQKAQAQKWKN